MMRAGGALEEAVGGRHRIARLIFRQDLNRLGHSLDLLQARTLAFLEVLGSLRASRLQVGHELLVCGESGLLLAEVLLRLGQVVHGGRQLVLLLFSHLVAVLDLGDLGRPELRECGRTGGLALLGHRQITLHLLLELLQYAKDFATLRLVGGVIAAAVVCLHERRGRLQRAPHECGVLGRPDLRCLDLMLQELRRSRVLWQGQSVALCPDVVPVLAHEVIQGAGHACHLVLRRPGPVLGVN
mmetsp:Transcript_7276/g.22526  ORF Transcript_7276/g.22526 Transcript_7276/m.22526 type:complete len:241 (-) Transcript_7276:535-1257(-)